MYYCVIGLLAIAVLLIENHDILLNRKGNFEIASWRTYRNFLFAILFYYLTDVTWGFFESLKMPGLLFADTTVYFFAMSVGVYFWAQYTVAYLEEEGATGQILVYLGRTVAGAILLLSVANIFEPIVFTIDEASVFHPLPARYIMLISQILLLFLISMHAASSLAHQPEEKKQRYRTITFFGMIMATLLTIQLFNPYLPLYSIGYMLGTCLLHAFVISAEKEEYDRMKKMVDNLKKEILGKS